MSRKESAQKQFEPYFVAAVLAARFKFRGGGFRQRDVRFLLELFTNWMEAMVGDLSHTIQNVQVARYLAALGQAGWIHRERQKKRGTPLYTLTRQGLIHLVSELVGKTHYLPLEQVFFVHYFLKSYGKLFDDLIQEDRAGFSPSLKAELTALREPDSVVHHQLKFIDKVIAKMEARIEEANQASELGRDIIKGGGTIAQVIEAIQNKYPYELNNRKPLNQLMKDVPEFFRPWEMTQGLSNRAQFLWDPMVVYLKQYRSTLVGLLR